MPTEESIHQVVGALIHLEKRLGRSPSVKDIAEQAGLTNGTAYNHLKRAVEKGLIEQREGKFMSLAIAKAFDKERGEK